MVQKKKDHRAEIMDASIFRFFVFLADQLYWHSAQFDLWGYLFNV